MKVLIACEESGTLRDRFLAAGHDCWSVDLKPGRGVRQDRHRVGDALALAYGEPWDLMICHPPCTYLCVSGLHWNHRRPERAKLTAGALEFALRLFNAPIARVCLENPVGCLSSHPDMPRPQWVQPYEFGDDASKRTGLWLRGLPPLVKNPALRIAGRMVDGRERWANQTDSGQNRLGPSPERAALRSLTYPGIARAMVAQWGNA